MHTIMHTSDLPPPISPLPASAADLQAALRRRREELNTTGEPEAEDLPAAELPPTEAPPTKKERKPMEPQRTKIDAQERAHIEALLRRNASPDELNAWRSERRIHHKTFAALVRALRQGLDAPPSPAAVQISALEPVALAASTDEPPAVITAAPTPTRPAQIQPVIDWLATVRAMRDELAVHGVTVAGSLRIEIEV